VVDIRSRLAAPPWKLVSTSFDEHRLRCQDGQASTSVGEASAWIQATDPERRETPRVRTALPGLRVEPKWLPDVIPDTPCSAEAPTMEVRRRQAPILYRVCTLATPPCVLAARR
jgi:hypothetical protein